MRSRLTAKPTVLLGGVAAVLAAVVSASRTWLTGTLTTAVRDGSFTAGATGAEVDRLVVPLALAAAAGLLAAATARRWGRVAGGAVAALTGGMLAVRCVLAALSAPERLADAAAERAGGLPTQAVSASAGPWLWLAFAGGVVLAVLGLVAATARGWRGLGAAYEATGARGDTVTEGRRTASADDLWDELSRGQDPT